MKKNRTLRVSALLLALTLITTCLVGGTFAKYTSSTTGSDTATVAKWSFKVNGAEFAVAPEEELTFDLFKTILDTGSAAEIDVKNGKLIAPGTSGSFDLKVTNDSEVNAKFTVALAETNASNVPLQYSVDNGTTWKDSIADLTMSGLTDQAIDMGATKTVTVLWRWVFEGTTPPGAHADQTDVTDTALGIAARTAAPTVTITATLTATQVD